MRYYNFMLEIICFGKAKSFSINLFEIHRLGFHFYVKSFPCGLNYLQKDPHETRSSCVSPSRLCL